MKPVMPDARSESRVKEYSPAELDARISAALDSIEATQSQLEAYLNHQSDAKPESTQNASPSPWSTLMAAFKNVEAGVANFFHAVLGTPDPVIAEKDPRVAQITERLNLSVDDLQQLRAIGQQAESVRTTLASTELPPPTASPTGANQASVQILAASATPTTVEISSHAPNPAALHSDITATHSLFQGLFAHIQAASAPTHALPSPPVVADPGQSQPLLDTARATPSAEESTNSPDQPASRDVDTAPPALPDYSPTPDVPSQPADDQSPPANLDVPETDNADESQVIQQIQTDVDDGKSVGQTMQDVGKDEGMSQQEIDQATSVANHTAADHERR